MQQRNPETRKPMRLGRATELAVRATFLLANGTRMDLTLCRDCGASLTPDDFSPLWQRVMASWIAESPGHDWPKTQVDNAIVALLGTKSWLEVA